MNTHHAELLSLIRKTAKTNIRVSKQPAGYEGHSEKSYGLSNPQLRAITKEWLKEHKSMNSQEFLALLDSLYTQATSSTEKYVSSFLLEYLPHLRKTVHPKSLDTWLDHLSGWGLVDSLCQSKFKGEEILSDWKSWKSLLDSLNTSPNINKRRASIVLLTGPVRDSMDTRFAELAITYVEKLKMEKDILITKSISWILRSMIQNHRDIVQNYLEENKDTIPKIAVREVSNKLRTGRK